MSDLIQEWSEEYHQYLNSKPEDGDFIRTEDDSPVRLIVDLRMGQEPFIFATVYVPSQVGCKLGWYAGSISSEFDLYGWKAVLEPMSRIELIKKYGIPAADPRSGHRCLSIKELKVCRTSNSGKSIICEVSEWL